MLALLLAAAIAPASADPALAEIARLEQQWGEALVKRDYATLERLVAPEYKLVVAREKGGYTATARDEWMKNALQFHYEQFGADTVEVTRVGDTAVASVQIANLVAQKPGEAAQPRASFVTDTWVRRSGRWQVIHRYSHRLPPVSQAPAR